MGIKNVWNVIRKSTPRASSSSSEVEKTTSCESTNNAETITLDPNVLLDGSPVMTLENATAPDGHLLDSAKYSGLLHRISGELSVTQNSKPTGRTRRKSIRSSIVTAELNRAPAGRKHLVMPDAQIKKGSPTDHLMWLGHYATYKKPDVIVCIGDFADMPSLCSYDEGKKTFEGRRYADDIEAARAAMARFIGPIRDHNEKARKEHRPLYTPEFHLTLGNHEARINRAIQKEARLDGTISINDLGYADMGWTVHPFGHPIMLDGVAYCHYFPSGPKGLPIGTAKKLLTELHCSCVAGHKPGRDIAYDTNAVGKQMTAIIAGSFYMEDQEYVLGLQANWQGFYMLHEVREGQFDEMAVSINYLRRKAEKDGWNG